MPTPSSHARGLVTLALGPLAWGLLGLALECLPLVPGEGWALRWLRSVGEHPVRGSLALSLGLLALTARHRPPGPRPTGPAEPQPLETELL